MELHKLFLGSLGIFIIIMVSQYRKPFKSLKDFIMFTLLLFVAVVLIKLSV